MALYIFCILKKNWIFNIYLKHKRIKIKKKKKMIIKKKFFILIKIFKNLNK